MSFFLLVWHNIDSMFHFKEFQQITIPQTEYQISPNRLCLSMHIICPLTKYILEELFKKIYFICFEDSQPGKLIAKFRFHHVIQIELSLQKK